MPGSLPRRSPAPAEAEAWVPSPSAPFCLSVQAVADVGTLARIFGQFAKRGLLPARWYSDLDPATDRLHVDVQVSGLSLEAGELIAQALRSTVGVEVVLTSRKLVGC
jgi:hypothetical protein